MTRDYDTVGQHLVSKVLLARFADKDSRVLTHTLDGRTFPQAIRKAGRKNDFIAVNADRYERFWGKFEGPAGAALRALEADEVSLAGRLAAAHEDALVDLMALHFARAYTAEVMWQRALDNTLPARRDGMATDPHFLAAMRTCAAMDLLTDEQIADIMAGYVARQVGLGTAAFGRTVAHQFRKVRRIFRQYHLEIGWAADGEFLLPDVPCVTYDKDSNVAGVLNGARIGSSDVVCMPATPRHLLSLTKNPAHPGHAVPVDRANGILVQNARQAVFYRPGSTGLDAFMREALRARGAA